MVRVPITVIGVPLRCGHGHKCGFRLKCGQQMRVVSVKRKRRI